jgi:hypothetical protein
VAPSGARLLRPVIVRCEARHYYAFSPLVALGACNRPRLRKPPSSSLNSHFEEGE